MNSTTFPQINYGGLREEISSFGKIIYYKKGFQELSLNITNACPNSCVFCIRDKNFGWGESNLYLEKDPPQKEIIEVLTKESIKLNSEKINIKKIKICGYGEPVLRLKEMLPVIAHIKKIYPLAKIQLATTGWPYFRLNLDNNSTLKRAKEKGLTHIYLSLNAVDKHQYKKWVRPGINKYDENAFDDAIRFGELSRDLGLDVTFGFVNLPNLNIKKAKNLAELKRVKYKIRKYEK